MKKQRKSTMKLAGMAAIAVLMTMSLVGTALAKYITEVEASDSARVAYWGIGAEENTVNLFQTEYIDNDGVVNTVKSSSDDNVVAPGTSGYAMIKLTAGSKLPEVAFTLSVEDVDVSFGNDGNEADCPLVFSVNGEEVGAEGLAETIKEAIGSKKYLPGEETLELPQLEISWEWPFEGTDADERDTELGNRGTDRISISATIRAVQVD